MRVSLSDRRATLWRLAEGAGLAGAIRQAHRLDSLEVAAGENSRFARPLGEQVAEIERGLAGLLGADQDPGRE